MTRNKALLPLILIFAFTALSQTLPQGVRKITAVECITEYALPNGLHVLLFPDSSKPNVTVNMTYMVGSRHEGYGETGMAHLLEQSAIASASTSWAASQIAWPCWNAPVEVSACTRSEEHTSELQSLRHLVCRLL